MYFHAKLSLANNFCIYRVAAMLWVPSPFFVSSRPIEHAYEYLLLLISEGQLRNSTSG